MDSPTPTETGTDAASSTEEHSHGEGASFQDDTDSITQSEADTNQTVDQAAVLEDTGLLFDQCIQQVSHLEAYRDELIRELLRLQEPMRRAAERLRAELVETRRLLTLAQLDYIGVHEEVQHAKRKLFATARDCIQSQVTLAQQEYEVAQSAVTQEELKANIQSLTQELTQLQEAYRRQLASLRDQARRPLRPRALSDASHCRQACVRIQRRLSGSMKTLEGWYEPRLLVLLKRRQMSEDALRKSREQATDLRAKLGPLAEDVQRLEVQRACLEQRITLMERDRQESRVQHKETVETLRETQRELQVEFEVQRKSEKVLRDRKEGLLKELVFLRGCDEPSETIAEEEDL